MTVDGRAQAVDLVILEERSGDFGESRRPMMMMSDAPVCTADPELTRFVVVIRYLGASRFLDLEAPELRFRTARTPRLSRRHVVNWARRSRFMHLIGLGLVLEQHQRCQQRYEDYAIADISKVQEIQSTVAPRLGSSLPAPAVLGANVPSAGLIPSLPNQLGTSSLEVAPYLRICR